LKRTALLAACVLTLAASTVYFARELRSLQDGEAGRGPGMAVSAADSVVAVPVREMTPTGNHATQVSAAAPLPEAMAPAAPETSPTDDAVRSRERAAKAARSLLARYENPETRKILIEAEYVSAQRLFALLRPRVELDDARWEKFLRLTVDLQVDRRVRAARCGIDPQCAKPELPAGQRDRERQQMVDLIGDRNVKKFEEFLRERPQTGSIAKFQARLGPTLALPPDQLSELARALSQEAAQTHAELAARGGRVFTFEGSHGVVVFSGDTRTLDERMASASASVLRLRERAGAFLDGERLRVFNQLQDDSLLKFRSTARADIAIAAAGYEQ
jgi:hypothetical protein